MFLIIENVVDEMEAENEREEVCQEEIQRSGDQGCVLGI